MSNHFNPGPPLTPENEFCECEPPSGIEYLKAAGAASLATLVGSGGWFGIVLFTNRLWGFTTVLIGLATGWTIHQAAGRHRSLALGIMSGATTMVATLVGYALLYLPFLSDRQLDRRFSWYDLIMIGLGAFVAYRLAGPKPKAKENDLS